MKSTDHLSDYVLTFFRRFSFFFANRDGCNKRMSTETHSRGSLYTSSTKSFHQMEMVAFNGHTIGTDKKANLAIQRTVRDGISMEKCHREGGLLR